MGGLKYILVLISLFIFNSFIGLTTVHANNHPVRDFYNHDHSELNSILKNSLPEDFLSIHSDSTIKNLQDYVLEGEKLWLKDIFQADSVIRYGLSHVDKTFVHDSVMANAYHLLGKILVDLGENEAGIDTFQISLELRRKVQKDNYIKISRTLNYIGWAYSRMYDFSNSEKYLREAANILTENGLVNQELYDAYINLSNLYSAFDKIGLAYEYYDKTAEVIDSIKATIDSTLVARFYFNISIIAASTGKFRRANKYAGIAESIYLKLYDSNYISIARINAIKGYNAAINHDYTQAKLFYKKANEIYLKNKIGNFVLAESYKSLSLNAMDLKDYASAIEYAKKGLSYKSSSQRRLSLLFDLASSLYELGMVGKADSCYIVASELISEENITPSIKIYFYEVYANFLFDIGRLNESNTNYRLAIAHIKTEYGKYHWYAEVISELANYFSATGQVDSADYYHNEAVSIFIKYNSLGKESFKPEKSIGTSFIEVYAGRANFLFKRYQQEKDVGMLIESVTLYKTLLDQVDLIRNKLDAENTYILFDQIKPIYQNAIEATYELYYQTRDYSYLAMAFAFAERSKSSVLLSSIQNETNLKSGGVPEEISIMDKQIKSDINGYRKLLTDEEGKQNRSEEKLAYYNTKLLEVMIRQDSLLDQIEINHPKYFELKYERPEPDLEATMNSLKSDEALLEYVLTDSALLIFNITNSSTKLHKLELDSLFHKALGRLTTLKTVNLTVGHKQEYEAFIRSSQELWSTLIGPVYEDIKGKRLIIIPDGLLGYLSFDFLIRPSGKKQRGLNYHSFSYLIKEFPISYAYSSSLKFNPFFDKQKNASTNFAGFSPSFNDYYNNDVESHRNGLKPLPGGRSEVLNGEEIFGGDVYIDDAASKSNFISHASDYKILHLAMHTFVNDSLPMFSELIFSDDDEETTDNKLLTYEIYDLNLNAEMVTLSACNTGSGKLQQGEGIISLSKGFVYAGVPSIVMTLWEVQDKSSSVIIKSFYTYLKQGLSKDEALRSAKLEFLENANMLYAHPYYWSGYIVTGDTTPLDLKKEKSNYIMFIGIGLVILLLIFMLIKAKSAKTD